MLHTTEALLSATLDEIIAGDHKCCLESATVDWSSLILDPEYKPFFFRMLARILNDNNITPSKENEFMAFPMLQALTTGLVYGTICGIGMQPALRAEVESFIEDLFKSALKEKPTFMKPGPDGPV